MTSTETIAKRTPQAERTRAMRTRLLEATIDCLVELGWSGTTTTVVSRRAGVSRGAQLHHFPTKQDLVVAAVDHIAQKRREDMAVPASDLSRARRTRQALDVLSAQFTSPVFLAALELWVAARTDEGLAAAVGPLERRVGRETHRRAVELLGVDESLGDNRRLVQATLDLIRGLGLAAILTQDRARRSKVLDTWASVLDAQLVAS